MLKINPKADVNKINQTKAWNGELAIKLLVGSIIDLVGKENAKGGIELEQLQYIQCSMCSWRCRPVIIRLKRQISELQNAIVVIDVNFPPCSIERLVK